MDAFVRETKALSEPAAIAACLFNCLNERSPSFQTNKRFLSHGPAKSLCNMMAFDSPKCSKEWDSVAESG
jgi:hypothetical protein